MLGGIQPDLLKCMYGSRGDDGFLDRLLLVGEQHVREAEWPRDVDDLALNAAWSGAIDRILHIEELASDTMGGKVEARFTSAAVDVCRQLMRRLNELVALLGVPEPQRGIVKKLVQHAVKLALLHRCFRWAAGDFGQGGPLGWIEVNDATAACEATLFFLGRWLLWRPELTGGHSLSAGVTVGLVCDPGSDPALLALAAAAAGDQSAIRLIEKLIRYGRHQGQESIRLAAFESSGLCAGATSDEIHGACQWLVQRGLGQWFDESKEIFGLHAIGKPRRRRKPKSESTGSVKEGQLA
jgi:hypothetical protein